MLCCDGPLDIPAAGHERDKVAGLTREISRRLADGRRRALTLLTMATARMPTSTMPTSPMATRTDCDTHPLRHTHS
jgi:hypothetical protein